jgi:hypothetical protein
MAGKNSPTPRIKRKEGDVVKIDLGNGMFSYARVLYDPLMAFYDFQSSSEIDVRDVISKPIAFVINVMHEPIKTGRWTIVGNMPLEDNLCQPVHFCRQDVLDPKKISISWMVGRGPDYVEVPATLEQCEGLERNAVWYDYHVEDRLRDHFAKRPCIWIESLRMKKPT